MGNTIPYWGNGGSWSHDLNHDDSNGVTNMNFVIKDTRVISKKNSRIMTMVGSRPISLPSKSFNDFFRNAGYQVWNQWDRHVITKPFALRCEFIMKGKTDTDVDNMFTSILDLFQSLGIIQNDKLCVEGSMTKKLGGSNYLTNIKLEEL